MSVKMANVPLWKTFKKTPMPIPRTDIGWFSTCVLNNQFNSLKKSNFLILRISIINSEVQYKRNNF